MFICFKYYVSNRNAQIDPNNRIFSRITQVTLLNNNYQARRCHHVSCSWNHHLMKTLLVLHRTASLTKYEYFKTWTTRANILQMDTIPLPFDFKCTVIVGLLYWKVRNSKNKKLNLKNKHPSGILTIPNDQLFNDFSVVSSRLPNVTFTNWIVQSPPWDCGENCNKSRTLASRQNLRWMGAIWSSDRENFPRSRNWHSNPLVKSWRKI